MSNTINHLVTALHMSNTINHLVTALNMSNTIKQTRLYITGMVPSHSILHYKVPGAGALHQALLEGCLHCPGLLTVTATVVLVHAAPIHPAAVTAFVPSTAE